MVLPKWSKICQKTRSRERPLDVVDMSSISLHYAIIACSFVGHSHYVIEQLSHDRVSWLPNRFTITIHQGTRNVHPAAHETSISVAAIAPAAAPCTNEAENDRSKKVYFLVSKTIFFIRSYSRSDFEGPQFSSTARRRRSGGTGGHCPGMCAVRVPGFCAPRVNSLHMYIK